MAKSREQKHIVFFLDSLDNGGAERVVSVLSGSIARRGIPVEVLTYYDRKPFFALEDKVRHTTVVGSTGSTNKLKNMLWMRKYLRRNADCVLSFLAPFNMMALAAMLGTGTPVIAADRNDPRRVPTKALLRKARDFLYRFARGVVVQTRHNQVYFSRTVREKSTVIFNPIDLGPRAGQALRTEKQPRIVSVGRLMPQKNQKLLLRAFAGLHERFPEYTLTIYGEGPERENLLACARELGIAHKLELPGQTDQIFDRISDAALFVLPSDYEGMPNALTEAMCLGLPVVSTGVSGATDLIRQGENGLLCRVGDAADLQQAMERMLEDTELRSRCAREAVALNELLTTDAVTDRWLAFLDKISDR